MYSKQGMGGYFEDNKWQCVFYGVILKITFKKASTLIPDRTLHGQNENIVQQCTLYLNMHEVLDWAWCGSGSASSSFAVGVGRKTATAASG